MASTSAAASSSISAMPISIPPSTRSAFIAPHCMARFGRRSPAAALIFFQSDSRVLADLRDLAFHRMKIIPWLRREMLLTLAGLKTGLFASASAQTLDGSPREKRRCPGSNTYEAGADSGDSSSLIAWRPLCARGT
jgi:hypothetical protein